MKIKILGRIDVDKLRRKIAGKEVIRLLEQAVKQGEIMKKLLENLINKIEKRKKKR